MCGMCLEILEVNWVICGKGFFEVVCLFFFGILFIFVFIRVGMVLRISKGRREVFWVVVGFLGGSIIVGIKKYCIS